MINFFLNSDNNFVLQKHKIIRFVDNDDRHDCKTSIDLECQIWLECLSTYTKTRHLNYINGIIDEVSNPTNDIYTIIFYFQRLFLFWSMFRNNNNNNNNKNKNKNKINVYTTIEFDANYFALLSNMLFTPEILNIICHSATNIIDKMILPDNITFVFKLLNENNEYNDKIKIINWKTDKYTCGALNFNTIEMSSNNNKYKAINWYKLFNRYKNISVADSNLLYKKNHGLIDCMGWFENCCLQCNKHNNRVGFFTYSVSQKTIIIHETIASSINNNIMFGNTLTRPRFRPYICGKWFQMLHSHGYIDEPVHVDSDDEEYLRIEKLFC